MDEGTAVLRQMMLRNGTTFTDLGAMLEMSEKTARRHVHHPEEMPVGELRRLVKEWDLTPVNVWKIVTGEWMTMRDLQNMTL